MIDVGYRWKNWNDALWALRRIEDDRLLFVETPLPTDGLDGMQRLADAKPTPVAAGEFLQTRHEFAELINRGHLRRFSRITGTRTSRCDSRTEARCCALAPSSQTWQLLFTKPRMTA
jgi:hypothetical protein